MQQQKKKNLKLSAQVRTSNVYGVYFMMNDEGDGIYDIKKKYTSEI